MALECINDIVNDNLVINIDITDDKSWVDYNVNNKTTVSLTKWTDAISDNINLYDFGLTGFDNGRSNIMWSGITLTPDDVYISLYPVGYNEVINPTTGQTTGVTVSTTYLPMTAITSGGSNNYFFDLGGGYLQGFFKLNDYNYKIFPTRYWKGITVETVLYIYSNTSGIFYMMGARAEDKYNPYFSGETITGTTAIYCSGTGTTSGVTTSNGNYLNAIQEEQVHKDNFIYPEDSYKTRYYEQDQIDDITNNVIAFEINENKQIGYKYVNETGELVKNYSDNVITASGFAVIDVVFRPYDIIYDKNTLECSERRNGDLLFYVNGRLHWKEKNFPEYYFRGFYNDGDKQVAVPYSISWGGGSFGLKHSWHYDYQTYNVYNGENLAYIKNFFIVTENPLSGSTVLSDIVLGSNTTMFGSRVMSAKYTGGTETANYIEFDNDISTLSNRDYTVNASIYDNGLFDGGVATISIVPISDEVDINIVGGVEYTIGGISSTTGTTGTTCITGITGQYDWKDISIKFRTADNSGQNNVKFGILIETTGGFNVDGIVFINNYTYTAADILVQDDRKDNLMIEQNFNLPLIAGIQKLRIYDNALTSAEILHNTVFESETKPTILVTKGGRTIYR